ncbi:MAG: AAA family ATPase [Intestinibacter bartlettii]|uniref:AAA family ATPase n=1 Tax=Intestinibacter bartlettii TaxID=261299 RepID=UPI0026EAFA9C|nr:AAA family ATPase [Intestinibacter bartlettii]MDO5010540.1 AAA family ATPase [Intestinibacter bartlettii]
MNFNINEFDIDKLRSIISYYKKNIKDISLDEIYKIEAINTFQQNWDINAKDFYEMISNSLSKSKNLLASRNYFPKNMILYFTQKDPEMVREMFVNLFNETISLSRRIDSFRDSCDMLLKQYGNENMSNHYQYLNAISTYLFFRFPEKYCIYKEGKFKAFATKVGYDNIPKRGSFDILEAYYNMCDLVLEVVKSDEELVQIAFSRFNGLNFSDNGLHLISEEIIYIGSRFNLNCETKQEINYIAHSNLDLIEENYKVNEKKQEDVIKEYKETYKKQDFLDEVYITERDYNFLVRILDRKKNIILTGAPGIGKTFLSKRLAYSILEHKDDDKIQFVQFHQNYSYEDFIMGYKPSKEGFELKYGVFYNFCKKAQKNPNDKYFFIIDEINRGNLSKIFGELMMLIENNYRGQSIHLAYGGECFSVPKNIYIIGIMNTADRSIAMIDYALRRRFSFFDLKPAFENERFMDYIKGLNSEKFITLVEKVKLLNKEIKEDFSLGEGFCIGHSYFFSDEISKESSLDEIDMYIEEIIEFDIIPLLKEYWFDDYDKIEKWEKILRDVIK